LALLVGMIGFGGMFAVYTYITTTMTEVAGLSRALVPVALMVFGLGMVVGNIVGGRLADRSVIRALYLSMGALSAVLAVFVVAAHNPWTALVLLFGIGAAGSAVGPALQTRLMNVAHDAQTLAAALSHSALNIGNATGAWADGLRAGLVQPMLRPLRGSHLAHLFVDRRRAFRQHGLACGNGDGSGRGRSRRRGFERCGRRRRLGGSDGLARAGFLRSCRGPRLCRPRTGWNHAGIETQFCRQPGHRRKQPCLDRRLDRSTR